MNALGGVVCRHHDDVAAVGARSSMSASDPAHIGIWSRAQLQARLAPCAAPPAGAITLTPRARQSRAWCNSYYVWCVWRVTRIEKRAPAPERTRLCGCGRKGVALHGARVFGSHIRAEQAHRLREAASAARPPGPSGRRLQQRASACDGQSIVESRQRGGGRIRDQADWVLADPERQRQHDARSHEAQPASDALAAVIDISGIQYGMLTEQAARVTVYELPRMEAMHVVNKPALDPSVIGVAVHSSSAYSRALSARGYAARQAALSWTPSDLPGSASI